MTNSGLIVFLPLVTAFVGAIIGAWANSWYRNREVKTALKEEGKGLLIVISAEIQYNTRLLGLIHEGKPSATIQNLRMDTWDETQVRFAQLFPADYTVQIANYYSVLAVHQISPIAHKTSTEDLTKPDIKAIQFSLTQGMSIVERAKSYTEDPIFSTFVDNMKSQIRTFE